MAGSTYADSRNPGVSVAAAFLSIDPCPYVSPCSAHLCKNPKSYNEPSFFIFFFFLSGSPLCFVLAKWLASSFEMDPAARLTDSGASSYLPSW